MQGVKKPKCVNHGNRATRHQRKDYSISRWKLTIESLRVDVKRKGFHNILGEAKPNLPLQVAALLVCYPDYTAEGINSPSQGTICLIFVG